MGQGLLALAVALLLLALLAIVPARVAAQPAGAGAAGAPPAGPTVADTMELRLEREVFNYPQFGRRNPFRPLVGDEAGPRFEDLQLLGVILSSEPGESVALLGIAQGMTVRPDSVAVESTVEEEPAVELARPTRSRTQRLRVGERWGSVRIVAIERNRVIVDVTEFGLTDRRELFLRRPDEGGIR